MRCSSIPSQNYSGYQFVVTSDGSGGTDVIAVYHPFSVTVSSGQTLTVSSGQTSSGVLVSRGGTLNVLSGGTVSGAIIDSGGTERVSGTDIGGTLERRDGSRQPHRSGERHHRDRRRVADRSREDRRDRAAGGTEFVSSGGTASNTVVSSGRRAGGAQPRHCRSDDDLRGRHRRPSRPAAPTSARICPAAPR